MTRVLPIDQPARYARAHLPCRQPLRSLAIGEFGYQKEENLVGTRFDIRFDIGFDIRPLHSGAMPRALICKQLHAEWQTIGRSAESRRALEMLTAREAVVADLGCTDLGELVARLQHGRPDSLSADEGAPVVAAMLHSSPANPLIGRALVQALYPGLTRVVRTLGGLQTHWDDLDSCFAEAVVLLWTVLDSWAGSARLYAGPDALSAVRCRMRRQALSGEDDRRRLTGLGEVEDRVPAGPERSDLEDLAVALGDPGRLGLNRAEAATICLTRVYGYTLKEVAVMAGTTRGNLQWRRERAEQCLVA